MILREDSSIGGERVAAAAARPGLDSARKLVADYYGVPVEALLAATRGDPQVAEARQVAMYLGHVVFRLSLAGIARSFGRDRTTASHACRRVELRREDPHFDDHVACLERLVRGPAHMRARTEAGR